MSTQAKSFTLHSEQLLRTIITDCGVCAAFDPFSPGPKPEILTFKGLWDTGASGTVIDAECAKKLGLKPISKTKVYHADGESVVNVYVINLFLPNQVAFSFVKVTEGKLNGFELLIGMDIICAGDFAISNFGGRTTFTFQVPSSRRIDFNEQSTTTPAENPFTGAERNQPCPCGSGKKYKKCHGK